MNDIDICAANPDNDFELRQLVRIFERVYGDSYPLRHVYDPQFWKTHISRRFTSLLAKDGKRVIGHIGACPDAEDSRHVELIYSLCDPEYCSDLRPIAQKAWQTLKRMSERQNWHSLYYIVLENVPDMQFVASEIFQAAETAILPGYLPSSPSFRQRGVRLPAHIRKFRAGQRTDTIMAQRIMNRKAMKRHNVYLPSSQHHIAEDIYHRLGLRRTLFTEHNLAQAPAVKIPRDAEPPGYELERFRTSERQHLFLSPSSIRSFEEVLSVSQGSYEMPLFVFIDAFDPACPQLAMALEEAGFCSTGIIPLIRGKDHLVYVRKEEIRLLVDCFSGQEAQRFIEQVMPADLLLRNMAASQQEEAHAEQPLA